MTTATTPTQGRSGWGGSDRYLWSVTTLLGALDKPALPAWAARETAAAAVRHADSLALRVAEEGETAVIDWLKGARFRPPPGHRTAADLGTAFHAAAEEFALTGRRPELDEEVGALFGRFEKWWRRVDPVVEAAELTVYNERFGYAGTCDAILVIGGRRFLVDYKTHNHSLDARGQPLGPYPEVALQLAAYRHAEFAVLGPPRRVERYRRRYYVLGERERAEARPHAPVDGALVIVVTPDHCTEYEVESGPEVFEAFLHVAEAARWSFETSRRVIGGPLRMAEQARPKVASF